MSDGEGDRVDRGELGDMSDRSDRGYMWDRDDSGELGDRGRDRGYRDSGFEDNREDLYEEDDRRYSDISNRHKDRHIYVRDTRNAYTVGRDTYTVGRRRENYPIDTESLTRYR